MELLPTVMSTLKLSARVILHNDNFSLLNSTSSIFRFELGLFSQLVHWKNGFFFIPRCVQFLEKSFYARRKCGEAPFCRIGRPFCLSPWTWQRDEDANRIGMGGVVFKAKKPPSLGMGSRGVVDSVSCRKIGKKGCERIVVLAPFGHSVSLQIHIKSYICI